MLSPNSYLEKALHCGGKITMIIMLGRESTMYLYKYLIHVKLSQLYWSRWVWPKQKPLLLRALRAPSCLAHFLLALKVLPRRTSILGACLWGLTPGFRNPSGTTATLGTAPSPGSVYCCPLGFQTVCAECRERWEGERLERGKGGKGTWRQRKRSWTRAPGGLVESYKKL